MSGRVLLVDHDQDFQQLAQSLLSDAGATVETIDNGRRAFEMALLAQARNNPYQLVLIDHDLPDWSGCSTTQRLREAGYRLPIVGLSDRCSSMVRQQFLAAGCESLILKPIHDDLLIVQLTAWLNATSN